MLANWIAALVVGTIVILLIAFGKSLLKYLALLIESGGMDSLDQDFPPEVKSNEMYVPRRMAKKKGMTDEEYYRDRQAKLKLLSKHIEEEGDPASVLGLYRRYWRACYRFDVLREDVNSRKTLNKDQFISTIEEDIDSVDANIRTNAIRVPKLKYLLKTVKYDLNLLKKGYEVTDPY